MTCLKMGPGKPTLQHSRSCCDHQLSHNMLHPLASLAQSTKFLAPCLGENSQLKFKSGSAEGHSYGPVRLAYKPYFFSQRAVFFSHNKLVNSTFSMAYQPNEQNI